MPNSDSKKVSSAKPGGHICVHVIAIFECEEHKHLYRSFNRKVWMHEDNNSSLELDDFLQAAHEIMNKNELSKATWRLVSVSHTLWC